MSKRLADATMQAMPPPGYDQFATKIDVANLGIALRGDIAKMDAGLRGDMAELRGDLGGEMRSNVKTIVLANLGTSLAVAGFVIVLS